MPIVGSDGSITLSVAIDEAELKDALASMKTSVKKTANGFSKVGGVIAAAFSISTIVRFSNEASKMASTTEASVQRLIDIYGDASRAIGSFIDENSRALGMSKAAATEFSAVYGNLFSVWADQATNAELTKRYLSATAVVASKTGRTMVDVQERIRSGLLGNTEAVEDLGIFVNVKTIEMTEAFQRVAKGAKWESLTAAQQSQIRSLAILEQATKKYGTEVANTSALTRAKYNAAFEDFKNTWGRVVNLILIPTLKVATRLLNTLTLGLQTITAMSGNTIDSNEKLKEQNDLIGEASNNQKDLTDELKSSAKAQEQLVAGFDEIEILSASATEGAGISGAVSVDFGEFGLSDEKLDEGKFTEQLVTIGSVAGWALVGLGIILMFSGHPILGIGMVASGYVLSEGVTEGAKDLGKDEKLKLAEIGAVVGSALIGLGVLLLFTPFWKLGLGMIAAGAVSSYEALGLSEFSPDIKKLISEILFISGIVAFTLGVILLFVGKAGMWKYGLGLMALGAGEVVGAQSLGGEQLKTEIETFVKNHWEELEKIGVLLVVVGIFLLFVNAGATWKYGLTFIAGGIAAVTKATELGEGQLKEKILELFSTYKDNILKVAAVMLILGIVLLFTPGASGYGLRLIALGAAATYATAKANNSEIGVLLTDFVNENYELIVEWATALLILGIILLFVPGTLGVGLFLIGSNVGLLYGAETASSGALKAEIMRCISENYNEIVGAAAALFLLGVVLLFVPGCLGFGLALIGGSIGALFLAEEAKLDSEALKRSLADELDSVNEVARSGVDDINETLGSMNFGSSSLIYEYGYGVLHGGGGGRFPSNGYANGTVVPPNRPHLAWFGDNTREPEIVSPISTMKQAYMEAAAEMGLNGQAVREEHYYLNETELMRIVYKLFKGGERLNGESFVDGGAF